MTSWTTCRNPSTSHSHFTERKNNCLHHCLHDNCHVISLGLSTGFLKKEKILLGCYGLPSQHVSSIALKKGHVLQMQHSMHKTWVLPDSMIQYTLWCLQCSGSNKASFPQGHSMVHYIALMSSVFVCLMVISYVFLLFPLPLPLLVLLMLAHLQILFLHLSCIIVTPLLSIVLMRLVCSVQMDFSELFL